MKVGEKAEFIFSPEYAYGKQKVSELIPENSTLNFEIELIEIEGKKKEIDDMEYEEKLEKGKKYKEEGVEKYKQGDYKGAREKFDEAAKYLDKYVNKYAEKEEGHFEQEEGEHEEEYAEEHVEEQGVEYEEEHEEKK